MIIGVGLRPSLVAPLRGHGGYLEAVPGLWRVADRSSWLQGGVEQEGVEQSCPLPLWTLYPSLVCSATAGLQEPAGRQVPSPACQAAAAWA